jgi:hypothetical protein
LRHQSGGENIGPVIHEELTKRSAVIPEPDPAGLEHPQLGAAAQTFTDEGASTSAVRSLLRQSTGEI